MTIDVLVAQRLGEMRLRVVFPLYHITTCQPNVDEPAIHRFRRVASR